MEVPNISSSVEKKERFGRNVTLVIDLIRHPEKDYATGNLTESGKKSLVEKLQQEYSDSEQSFDIVKCYVSPLKRGQQAMEPLSQFLRENDIHTTIRTKDELVGGMTVYSSETDKVMDDILRARRLLEDNTVIEKKDALEPSSKDEETLKNEILIREFFNKEFPKLSLKGEDVGKELDGLMRHFVKMAQRFHSGSKVKMVLIGHSGVTEYLTKLIYLKNHPELKPEEVGVEEIGGLLDYMSGPRITMVSDDFGKQKATFEFKDLSLEYPLNA